MDGPHFESAGSRTKYFIAVPDGSRIVVTRLSGTYATEQEALCALAWQRRHHPEAQIVRDLHVRSVTAKPPGVQLELPLGIPPTNATPGVEAGRGEDNFK